MTSIIKVNEIQDAGGNTILSSNGTGTFTSNLPITNTPAFEARLSNGTYIPTAWTLLEFGTEIFDTNNCYNNTASNYKFTPTSAGKYFVYAFARSTSSSVFNDSYIAIYKNGSLLFRCGAGHNEWFNFSTVNGIVDMNGTTDYIQSYYFGGANFNVDSGSDTSRFGAYKLIGA